MPKTMNTLKRDGETALPGPTAESVTDGLPLDGQNWSNGA